VAPSARPIIRYETFACTQTLAGGHLKLYRTEPKKQKEIRKQKKHKKYTAQTLRSVETVMSETGWFYVDSERVRKLWMMEMVNQQMDKL